MKLPKRAGGRSAPHVPNRTTAMSPLTAARASRTTKSMLGIPMSVVMMDTGTPLNVPAQRRCMVEKVATAWQQQRRQSEVGGVRHTKRALRQSNGMCPSTGLRICVGA